MNRLDSKIPALALHINMLTYLLAASKKLASGFTERNGKKILRYTSDQSFSTMKMIHLMVR
jgi:hypothetical protein